MVTSHIAHAGGVNQTTKLKEITNLMAVAVVS